MTRTIAVRTTPCISVNAEVDVRSGAWNPEDNERDREHHNTLAARGYYDAFQAVKRSVEQVLKGDNAGDVAGKDHADWYGALFGPSVTAGILNPGDLAGYRTGPVHIRNSLHAPPSREAMRDMMPVLFELLSHEQDPAVRVVLGHFIFVYIHPYFDGNGRIGRFLMNVGYTCSAKLLISQPDRLTRSSAGLPHPSSCECASVTAADFCRRF